MRHLLLPALLLVLAAPTPVSAGESYDNCSGFIDSIPATITTQGVWCLRADLSTAVGAGNAITVAANNVTIDCNHFKLGGLAAGAASAANGISSSRANTTVRNCNIRGFLRGVLISSPGGNLIESNRFDGNLLYGILTSGSGTVVRNNLVLNTGGSVVVPQGAIGIYAENGTDILANVIAGVFATELEVTDVFGIYTVGSARVRDNHVKGLLHSGLIGASWGIYNEGDARVLIRDNDLEGSDLIGTGGIRCGGKRGSALGNAISGFSTPVAFCNATNWINPD